MKKQELKNHFAKNRSGDPVIDFGGSGIIKAPSWDQAAEIARKHNQEMADLAEKYPGRNWITSIIKTLNDKPLK